MKFKSILMAVMLVMMPVSTLAQSGPDIDLGITAGDISFSTDILIVGDQVRLYAGVRNLGIEDVSGYVSFFQGEIPIGNSQVVSVRSGGVADEVYVDFIIPNGQFNIRAEIRGTDPQDENINNDVAVTNLFYPIFDDDGDGVPNEEDNCPDVANPAQNDTDNDGAGNACDDDDDDDTLTDEVEEEIGTNPHNPDTDGDGVNDALDFYPTDPTRSAAPVITPEPEPEPEPTDETEDEEVLDEESEEEDLPEPALFEEEEEESVDMDRHGIEISPKAIFTYKKVNWNSYEFNAIAQEAMGYRYEWDFGDGVTSNRKSITHTYRQFGTYEVNLAVRDLGGTISRDETEISVSFFNLENPYLKALLGLLGLLLLFFLILFFRSGKKREEKPEPIELVETNEEVIAAAKRKTRKSARKE